MQDNKIDIKLQLKRERFQKRKLEHNVKQIIKLIWHNTHQKKPIEESLNK